MKPDRPLLRREEHHGNRAFPSLLDAIRDGADAPSIQRLLDRPDLDRLLPGLGLPREYGIRCLASVGEIDPHAGLDPNQTQVVEYFQEMVHQRPHIEGLLAELASKEDEIIASAFLRTSEHLPPGATLGQPRLVPLPLAFDFRTDRETVYFDPLAALAMGVDGFRHTLIHEFHHVARYRRTHENLTLMRPDERIPPIGVRETFAEWAAWLEAEGIADQASNMTQTDVPQLRAAVALRVQQLTEYAELIGESMTRLRDASRRGPVGQDELSRLSSWLLQISHPVGSRMARIIEASFGRSGLSECVGQPRRFLERYNEAATRSGARTIDPDIAAWVKP